LSKILLAIILGNFFFAACTKERFTAPHSAYKMTCELQTDNPSGRSYAADSVVSYDCNESHCGFLPLSDKNYWVYEDSFFIDGVFNRVQIDTLRYTQNYLSIKDNLVWWKGNIFLGIPETIYSSDSALFNLTKRNFAPNIMDAKKEFALFPGDSIKYLTSFGDIAAKGRSVKIMESVKSRAAEFFGSIFFEKHAVNYRRDQVYFQPHVGVIRYIREKARPGSQILKLEQVSSLVSYHIE
jgi:hypothetical protein